MPIIIYKNRRLPAIRALFYSNKTCHRGEMPSHTLKIPRAPVLRMTMTFATLLPHLALPSAMRRSEVLPTLQNLFWRSVALVLYYYP